MSVRQFSKQQSEAMVINGHGAKTSRTIDLSGHDIYTPGSLHEAYTFNIPPTLNLEKTFRQGKLYQVNNGKWTHYTHTSKDVDIGPWKKNEASLFFKRLLSDQNLWSSIDNELGLLYKRDPNASLLVRENGQLKALKGQALFNYCQSYHETQASRPLAFITPKIGKVKILNHTNLKEILDGYKLAYGTAQTFMLATCNATLQSKAIHLDANKPTIHVADVSVPSPAILNAMKPKPQVQPEPDVEQLITNFSKLGL